jgi:DNA-binding beta-propeller fold protein YncE
VGFYFHVTQNFVPSLLALTLFLPGGKAFAQSAEANLPNPFRPAIENWAKLPAGRSWGAAPAVAIDRACDIWVFERCGGNTCAGRSENPILEFDPSGKLVTSFGAGMFVFPHGIFIDKDNNVWVADADGEDGKGHTVVKFSPTGKVLMTLGKSGVAGDGPETFNRPTGVAIARNGDIYVCDGHGGASSARIVKFSKDGKFITAWGKKGKGPGEFDTLHGIALDSKGRVCVADRGNNRIQIFDSSGKFLDQWTQFSNPSGIFIDSKDVIYVADDTSSPKTRPDWPRAIRIGSAKDGRVSILIPEAEAEDVVADAKGNVYAAEVSSKSIKSLSGNREAGNCEKALAGTGLARRT